MPYVSSMPYERFLFVFSEMNSETEGCDDASIDIKGNSSERHEHLTTNV